MKNEILKLVERLQAEFESELNQELNNLGVDVVPRGKVSVDLYDVLPGYMPSDSVVRSCGSSFWLAYQKTFCNICINSMHLELNSKIDKEFFLKNFSQ